ncbi:alpha/beta hydrolase [Desulfospira joergensenii]|uniref:alpha/beta hydrolase n=1 Tax=Desulfospira joergensenii TaxID=53329 RepID=UPI0003B6FBB3|nr:alpha/beta hydrolase [Desulfospira joergensenii]
MEQPITPTRLSFLYSWVCLVLALWVFVPGAFSRQASYEMPSDIDPSARYLFFLHNYYVEKNGPGGDCRYQDILRAFEEKGFTVISELRSGKIIPCTYAAVVTARVKTLLESNVPPRNIVVAGHSKGGVIGLCMASQLENSKIQYVIMAGCEIASVKKYKMYPDFRKLKGRILSIYAESDKIAGSCNQAFSHAAKGLSNTEIKLKSNAGHRLFFTPDDIWLSPMFEWIKRN